MGQKYLKVGLTYVGDDCRKSTHTLYFCFPGFMEHTGPYESFLYTAFENTMRTMPRRLGLGRLMKKVGRGMECCGITFLGESIIPEGVEGAKTAVWKPERAKIPPGLEAEPVDACKGHPKRYNGIKGNEWVLGIDGIEPKPESITCRYSQGHSLYQRFLNIF